MKPVDQQVILITGATDGIGKGTAWDLAQQGATLLLHGRNAAKLATLRDVTVRETGNDRIETYSADFSSLTQVRRMAEKVSRRHRHLDVLLNNAGIGVGRSGAQQREVSADGHELRWAVNHLAPFLLTHLLLPVLVNDEPSRVVNVTSAAQQPIDFDDIMLEKGYSGFRAYSQSKLAMVMATFEFASRLQGEVITINCLHPGSLLDTKIVREGFGSPQGDVQEGVRAEVFVATAPELDGVSGQYFDQTRRARANAQAYDADARARLWRHSEQRAGIG